MLKQVKSDVRVAIRDINDNPPYFMCAPYQKLVSEVGIYNYISKSIQASHAGEIYHIQIRYLFVQIQVRS